MPRYFFHLIHPGLAPVRDEEGMTFEDDDVAKREGLVSLGELIAESSRAKPMPFKVSVQVVREGVGIIYLLTGDLSFLAQP